jgi:hypothetical protein
LSTNNETLKKGDQKIVGQDRNSTIGNPFLMQPNSKARFSDGDHIK